jgi:hypothetical protein
MKQLLLKSNKNSIDYNSGCLFRAREKGQEGKCIFLNASLYFLCILLHIHREYDTLHMSIIRRKMHHDLISLNRRQLPGRLRIPAGGRRTMNGTGQKASAHMRL